MNLNLKEIGVVISKQDSPSTSKIDFVCTKNKVHTGSYIQINYSQGYLVGLITNVVKRNRYFENSDSIKEFEDSNINLSEQFPSDEWEFLEAKVKPLGVLNKNNFFIRSTLPVSPGDQVYLADKNILKRFLHFKEKGLFLGHIEHPKLDVKFSLDKLLQKHLAILAQSGAGKSYLTSVIIEELLNRKKEDGRIGTILFDTHGEYSYFSKSVNNSNNKDYSNKTIYINSKDIKIGSSGLSISFLCTLLSNISSAQKRELSLILKKLNKDKRHGAGPFGLKDIIQEVKNSDIKENVAKPLINSLYSLQDYNLFSKVDSPSVYDIIQPGKLTIVDFSKEINQRKKQIILYYFAHKLFYSRVNSLSSIPPFLLIVEEAHQFAPESVTKDYALAKGILERIAREGRKFGASVCLISQRPVKLSTTVLSQANTHIILRITNPYDLKHIGESSEGLDQKSIDMITSLRVGEALVVGEASNYPVFFKVRTKDSIDSDLDVTLSGLSKSYEEKKDEKDKEIKSFM